MLVKTAGVKHLVILINKMDDPTVKWEQKRYDYCKDQLSPYLKSVGFNPAKGGCHFMPCSGLTGQGIMAPVGVDAPWYTGLPFIPYIDGLDTLKRHVDGPFMMPIVDKYSEMGTVLIGKVESGGMKTGDKLVVMPNRTEVKVDQIWSDDIEVTEVTSGENIKCKVKGIEESDVTPGFVLCCPANPIKTGRVFDAQVVMLDLKSIICAGYSCMLHLQAMAEEVTIQALICLVDKKTGEKSKTRPRFIKQDQIAIARFTATHPICMETFKAHPQLGRFTLRDEGTTIAIGKILKVVE
jgi:peptide chain release factor subunit 3